VAHHAAGDLFLRVRVFEEKQHALAHVLGRVALQHSSGAEAPVASLLSEYSGIRGAQDVARARATASEASVETPRRAHVVLLPSLSERFVRLALELGARKVSEKHFSNMRERHVNVSVASQREHRFHNLLKLVERPRHVSRYFGEYHSFCPVHLVGYAEIVA